MASSFAVPPQLPYKTAGKRYSNYETGSVISLFL